MSTKLHDLPAQAWLAASIVPGGYTEGESGAPIDLLAADGRGFAVLHVGALAGGTTILAWLEQSADQINWDPIPAAEFPEVTAGSATHALGFDRSARYVRASFDLGGDTPSAGLCIAIGQQRKTI
jgi:hypothetical protein